MTTQSQAEALAEEIKRLAGGYANAAQGGLPMDEWYLALHAAIDRLRDLAASFETRAELAESAHVSAAEERDFVKERFAAFAGSPQGNVKATREGCNYLARANGVCNKCGEIHWVRLASLAASAPQGDAVEFDFTAIEKAMDLASMLAGSVSMSDAAVELALRELAQASEPVAWRWIPSQVFGDYVYTDDKVRADEVRTRWRDVEPLYTRPAPAASVPADETPLLRLVSNIRFAVGDDGRRMQDELIEYLKQMRADAEAHRAGGLPAGYVLVPVDPNEEMHVAAVRTIVRCNGNDEFPSRVWRAMLAAAPDATKQEE